MNTAIVFACLLLLAGCIKTEDEKRMACLAEAAEAPTTEGVRLKQNMCLLDYPVKPGQFVNGTTNWSQFTPVPSDQPPDQ